jgi:hypothetical protein
MVIEYGDFSEIGLTNYIVTKNYTNPQRNNTSETYILQVGDRILIKDQGNFSDPKIDRSHENGIYEISDIKFNQTSQKTKMTLVRVELLHGRLLCERIDVFSLNGHIEYYDENDQIITISYPNSKLHYIELFSNSMVKIGIPNNNIVWKTINQKYEYYDTKNNYAFHWFANYKSNNKNENEQYGGRWDKIKGGDEVEIELSLVSHIPGRDVPCFQINYLDKDGNNVGTEKKFFYNDPHGLSEPFHLDNARIIVAAAVSGTAHGFPLPEWDVMHDQVHFSNIQYKDVNNKWIKLNNTNIRLEYEPTPMYVMRSSYVEPRNNVERKTIPFDVINFVNESQNNINGYFRGIPYPHYPNPTDPLDKNRIKQLEDQLKNNQFYISLLKK